jgi:carboxyl-terminal processing protease
MGCLSVVVLLSALFIGVGIGIVLERMSGGQVVSVAGISTQNTTRQQLEPTMSVFWEAMDVVYQNFYGALPDPQDAIYSAIRGVVNSLDDQHTSFLTPEEAEQFRSNLSGEFEGIGARVDWDEELDAVIVVEPFENQPAWNAGIRRDDRIIAIDGEPVAGLNLSEAVQRIRGPKGTTVRLTIRREGVSSSFDVDVVRDQIEMPTIRTDSLGPDGEIAYVRLYTFNENAGQLVRQAVEDAVKRQPKGLIFDLRGNGGGLLREAVKVANVFIQDQTVLIERFKDGKTETYETTGKAVDSELPMLVLVNEASASASEIVAGALQDAGRARLLGQTTFGKGSVQLPQSLSDGSIVRITIARWYTPKDRGIDGTGLKPDVPVELNDADREVQRDPQLDAALEMLLEDSGQ